MQKNVASQKWRVFAFDRTNGAPKTGDAANITAKIAKDWGTKTSVTDTNPTETEDGYYEFDISQSESNGNVLDLYPESSTADIQVIGVPGSFVTTPPNFSDLGIESDGDLTKVNLCASNTDMRGTENAATEAKQDIIDTVVDLIAARLTAARAGYLDNLNIGGNVAGSSEVLAIQNNTRVRVIVPQVMERPDSGSTLFKLHLYLYDNSGNMEAPDSLPAITAENQSGTDRSSNLGTVTLEATGHYSVTYSLASGDSIEQLLFIWTVTEGGVARLHGSATQVVDTTAVDFTAADRTKLDTLHDTRIPDVLSLTNINAQADTALTDFFTSAAKLVDDIFEELLSGHLTVGTLGKAITDIIGDTNELQTDLADGGRLDLLIDAINTNAARLTSARAEVLTDLINGGRLDILIDAIKDATDLIAATPATESYAADGAEATLVQINYMILSFLTSLKFVDTTGTARKLDGSTAAMTFTIDDASNPTDINRAT